MTKINIAVAGATGFTGSELVRLLLHHPSVNLCCITSASKPGEMFSTIHPQFKTIADMILEPMENLDSHQPDIVFLALPHGVSMDFVRNNLKKKYKIIDLSADFRLSSAEVYRQWYNHDHSCPDGLQSAVYGLPEFFKDEIRTARLIANPGCYVTSALLALAPLIKNKLVDTTRIIVDAKSGVSGAGVKATAVTHFDNVNDNFKPYGIKTHRHTIEIQEITSRLSSTSTTVQFTPHLLPVDRGIITSAYTIPITRVTDKMLQECFAEFYKGQPFIRISGQPPAIKNIRGSNYCDLMVSYDERTGNILSFSALDNLVKGAAGQAIQNMNLMAGLDEIEGLKTIPLSP